VRVPLLGEEVLKKEGTNNQKSHRDANENESPYSTSERCTTHSQDARKFLSVNNHVDPALPQLCTDIPLSSADCNNSEEKDDHIGTLKRVTELRRNGAQCEYGERGEESSDQTDPEGSVRGECGETWDAEALEEGVPRVEET
jgi:hypothetical protein